MTFLPTQVDTSSHFMWSKLRLKISPPVLQLIIHLAIAFGIGLLWFFALYNRFSLYTSHVDWTYIPGGDVLQHQLGWEWFRQESWRFPLGSIQAYGYPVGSSVAFLDAIPLFAIPFKLLSPFLETDFQYFGIWELSAVMGQMFLGLLILNEFTRSYPLKILGASLLVLSPPMIFRAFYHSSLSAHWILLAGIWFILLEYRQALWRGAWVILFAVALSIHTYFIPMLLPLWAIGLFFHYQKAQRRWTVILEVLAVMAALFLVGYGIGLFSLKFTLLSVGGYGDYSWNMNSFFNPFRFSSAYVKEMVNGKSGQYEGFSYLGLGTIMALPAVLYVFIQKGLSRRRLVFLVPCLAAALVLTLFSLTNEAYLGVTPLWNIPLPQPVIAFFSLFRSSGRLIWPVFYFVVLFVLYNIIRNIRYPVPVLLLVVLLQFSDLQPLSAMKRLDGPTVYERDLQGEFWLAAAETNDHIVVTPNQKLKPEFEPVVLYAVHNHFTINLGYFARTDSTALGQYAEQVWKDINANRLDRQTIYMIASPERIETVKNNLSGQALICKVDGFTILLSPDNDLAKNGFDISRYCSVPAP